MTAGRWYYVSALVLLTFTAAVGVVVVIVVCRRRRSAALSSAIHNAGGGGGGFLESKSLYSQQGSLLSIASTSSSRSTAPLIQTHLATLIQAHSSSRHTR